MKHSRDLKPDTDRRAVAPLLLAAAVVLGLAATTEERLVGTSTDDQQMLETSVALAEFGEVGLPRGGPTLVDRAGGDAVSPFGLALPLLEVLPSSLARPLERRFGPGSSQALYAALQVSLIALAALLSGALAGILGAGGAGRAVAVLGTAFASPLWAYEAAAYSEPLQAVAVTAAAVLAYGSRSRRAAAGAGACLALAILAKSPNVLLAPFLLLPAALETEDDGPVRRRGIWIALGALPLFLFWLAAEIVRFGRPLASYGGHSFSYPWFEGLWRLLVGPNKGFFVYFPLGVLGVLWLVRNVRRGASLGILLFSASLLALSSGWWAWDGTVGWGPRLLVPAVPLVAAAAGAALERRGTRIAAWALLGAGTLVNLPGVLVPEAAVTAYLAACPRVRISPAEAATLPEHYRLRTAEGVSTGLNLVAARDAALAPIRLHAFFLLARLGASTEEIERRLASPPWASARPWAVAERRSPAFLRQPFTWPFLGRGLSEGGRVGGRAAWYQGEVAQVYRAIDVGAPARAAALAQDLYALQPSGFSAALRAESLRAAARFADLDEFLASLPAARRDTLAMGIVRALAARDRGDESAAREILRGVVAIAPRPNALLALESPLAAWPKSMREMAWEETPGRVVGLPGLGR